ncbi:MAG TPA: site-specific integrase [Gaiellaceae bacterium]
MAKRKQRPFGTIFERNGRWIFTVGLNGERHWKSFDAREQAELYRTRMSLKKQQGEPLDELDPAVQEKRKTTLAEFSKLWLPHVKLRVRYSTYVGYESHVRTHLVPTLGDYPLSKLTRQLLAQFFSDWASGGSDYEERVQRLRDEEERRWQAEQQTARERELRLAELEGRDPWLVDARRRPIRIGNSRGTIQNGLTCLRSMLGTAVEWGYIATNPAVRPAGSTSNTLLPKKDGVTENEIQPLTAEEVEKLLSVLDGTTYLIVATAVATGMRRGELFGLKWMDFDRQQRRLWVRRSVDRRGTFQEPKTRRSKRQVGVPPTLVQALLEHRMGSMFKTDNDLIFPNSRGLPASGENFCRREFRPALKKAKVPQVRFHDLRHTFASLLIEQGVHMKTISEALGHASIQITMDRYGHLYEQAATDAADELEAVVFKAPVTALAEARRS